MRFLRNTALVLVACLVGVLILEGASRVLFAGWREFDAERFMALTQEPGFPPYYHGRPGFDGWFAQNNGDFRVHIHINQSGFREEEPPEAADGRIWMVGDSFTFGWGAEKDVSFAKAAGRLVGMETYNLASPGADVCSYRALIKQMPEQVKPRAVVVGLTLENDVFVYDCQGPVSLPEITQTEVDLGWSLSDLKQRLMHSSALYNVLATSLKRIPAINEFLVGLGLVKHEHVLAKGALAENMAPRIASTVEQLVQLRQDIPPGTPMAVMLIPTRFEIRDQHAPHRALRETLGQAIANLGIAVIDPTEAMIDAGFDQVHFSHDGHWLPKGHDIAARAIAAWLKQTLPHPTPETTQQ